MNNDKNIQIIDSIKSLRESIEEPENIFQGKPLPKNISLPDNLLLFYHNYSAPNPNSHFRYTLVFPLSSMTYYVDQHEIEMFPGEILLIHPHQLRYLHPASDGYDRLFITFELREPQSYLPVCPLNQLTETTRQHLRRFIEYYQSEQILEASIELLYLLMRLEETKTTGSIRKVSSIAADTVSYINENLNRQFGNRDIARALNVSESNLRLRFKKETGITLSRYIAKLRLEAAAHRLKQTDMNIEEIAISCGYNTIYAFSHFFKKNMGISPLFYRQRL